MSEPEPGELSGTTAVVVAAPGSRGGNDTAGATRPPPASFGRVYERYLAIGLVPRSAVALDRIAATLVDRMDLHHRTRFPYEAPRIAELGDLVDLTAQGQGGLNKPCSVADGMSGTIGNCSGGGGGGIGS